MMSFLAPIIYFLIFLLPPFLLVSAIIRLQRRIGWTTKTHGMTTATTVVFLAAVINSLIVFTHVTKITTGQLDFTWPVVVGFLISWCCFWARLAIRPLYRRRRRSTRQNPG